MSTIDQVLGSLNRSKERRLEREERKADRELTLLLTQMKLAHERDMSTSRHNEDMIERYSATNLKTNKDGRMVLKDNFDPSDMPEYKISSAQTDVEALRARGLPVTDDEDLNRNTVNMYDKGKKAGLSYGKTTLANEATAAFQIDVTPQGLTSDDFNSFQLVYQSAGGAESPEMLNYLINDLGIIDRSDVYQDNTGMPTIFNPTDGLKDNSKAALIDNAIVGFRDGIQDNIDFLTSAEYDNKVKEDAMFGINYANAMAESIPSQRAKSNLLNRGKIFWNSLQPQVIEGEKVIMWNNELVKLRDITDEIRSRRGQFKGLSSSEATNLTNRMEQFSRITQDGTGFQAMVEELLGQADQGDSELQLISKYIDTSLAKTITSGIEEWDKVSRVGQAAMKYYQDPQSIGEAREANQIQNILVTSGLKEDLIKLRHMPEGTTDYAELDAKVEKRVHGVARSLMQQGGAVPYLDENGNTAYEWEDPEIEAVYNQFLDWLDLEDSLFEFNKGVN